MVKPQRPSRTKKTSTSTANKSDVLKRRRKQREADGAELVSSYDKKLRVREARQPAALPDAPHTVPVLKGGKETTSPELATLAAKYLNVRAVQLRRYKEADLAALARNETPEGTWESLARDIRRLAASVLTQFEGAKQ